MSNNNINSLGGYGAILDPAKLQQIMTHVITSAQGQKAHVTPICVWGKHGIGKTSIAQSICREKGWKFAFCAPAQFEEMGDFNGMPVVTIEDGVSRTDFAIPDWVPTEEGPGILLMDDFNRADDRIVRGLMTLLQMGGLTSWQLPTGWIIVCTANPEGDVYSVTSLDPAILNRLANYTMDFDPVIWGRWASVNQLDTRLIGWVLAYPEMVKQGVLTTPRSLEAASVQLKAFPNVKGNVDMLSLILSSLLDTAAVSSLISYLTESFEALVSPEEIYGEMEDPDRHGQGAMPWDSLLQKLNASVREKDGSLNVSAATVTAHRAFVHLFGYVKRNRDLPQVFADKLKEFLLTDAILADVASYVHSSMVAEVTEIFDTDVARGNEALKRLRDPRMSRKISSLHQ